MAAQLITTLPIEAVVFDLDDTLFDDTTSFRGAAEVIAGDLHREFGTDPKVVLETYTTTLAEFWEGLTSSDVGRRVTGMRARVWSATLATCGLDAADGAKLAERYDELRRPSFVLWPGVIELLTDLRAAGSKLAILTNGLQETHREKIRILGLEPFVDRIYISDEIGMAKPDPRLFTLVCSELGVEPRQATMVGDRYSRDVIGAAEIGMKTVWLDFRDETVPADGPRADVVVKTIQEAATALRAAVVS